MQFECTAKADAGIPFGGQEGGGCAILSFPVMSLTTIQLGGLGPAQWGRERSPGLNEKTFVCNYDAYEMMMMMNCRCMFYLSLGEVDSISPLSAEIFQTF